MYRIIASVTKIHEDLSQTGYNIPTFYLDPQCQGITDATHAEKVARDIINPTNDHTIKVNVCAVFVFPD
jgi:hypothetical protein